MNNFSETNNIGTGGYGVARVMWMLCWGRELLMTITRRGFF